MSCIPVLALDSPSKPSSLTYFICKMEIQNTHSVFLTELPGVKPKELGHRGHWPLLKLSLWELHTPPPPCTTAGKHVPGRTEQAAEEASAADTSAITPALGCPTTYSLV